MLVKRSISIFCNVHIPQKNLSVLDYTKGFEFTRFSKTKTFNHCPPYLNSGDILIKQLILKSSTFINNIYSVIICGHTSIVLLKPVDLNQFDLNELPQSKRKLLLWSSKHDLNPLC